ncbi:glutaredoxin family protein [Siminovitchia sediminis]|uniref:Glutaredoxin family protein n=1 Tax=Siminovitchia sediminis TaxID=1274353 RepID=A0ABW4KN92_9BACI
MKVYYYTRNQCELCREGKLLVELLQEDYPFEIVERDIDTNEEWTERFGLMIPVVEIDGEIIQYGKIDLMVLEEYIKTYLNQDGADARC